MSELTHQLSAQEPSKKRAIWHKAEAVHHLNGIKKSTQISLDSKIKSPLSLMTVQETPLESVKGPSIARIRDLEGKAQDKKIFRKHLADTILPKCFIIIILWLKACQIIAEDQAKHRPFQSTYCSLNGLIRQRIHS